LKADQCRLTVDEVRSLLDYCPATGILKWKFREPKFISASDAFETQRLSRSLNNWLAGKPAGYINRSNGYLMVRLLGKAYVAHRLAYYIMTGDWPHKYIDHINRDKTDNRWSNLRLADVSENQANSTAQKNNKSGRKGVSWDASNRKWRAQICVRGQQIILGRFDDIDLAADAYVEAAKRYFGDYARAS
jgi:hypothetical protein